MSDEVPHDSQHLERLRGLAANEEATRLHAPDRESIRWAIATIDSFGRERDALRAERQRLRRFRERVEDWIREGEGLLR